VFQPRGMATTHSPQSCASYCSRTATVKMLLLDAGDASNEDYFRSSPRWPKPPTLQRTGRERSPNRCYWQPFRLAGPDRTGAQVFSEAGQSAFVLQSVQLVSASQAKQQDLRPVAGALRQRERPCVPSVATQYSPGAQSSGPSQSSYEIGLFRQSASAAA